MNIEINEKDLKVLQSAIMMANDVVNGHRMEEEKVNEYVNLLGWINMICNKNKVNTSNPEKMVISTLEGREDKMLKLSYLEYHDIYTFWNQLARRLAERDARSLETDIDSEAYKLLASDLFKEYWRELKYNGVEFVHVIGSFKAPDIESIKVTNSRASAKAIKDALKKACNDICNKVLERNHYVRVKLIDGNYVHLFPNKDKYRMLEMSEASLLSRSLEKGEVKKYVHSIRTQIMYFSSKPLEAEVGDEIII